MAFGRLNRHDAWLQFCELHRTLLADTGLPDTVALSEDRFRDLLRDGSVAGCGVTITLAELNAQQWFGLERFAAVFFHECESCTPLELFPAFRREAERRSTDFRV